MKARGRAVVVCATVVALVALAVPAFAHVSIETDNARPGAESEYTITVPNESESADTTSIEVQLPAGLEVTGFEAGKGWTMRVESEILVIDGGKLAPGERRDFRFTAVNPRDPGELEFPAIQTYSDGEEVRWVGTEDSDHPAARVTIEGKPVAQATEPQPPAVRPSRSPATESPGPSAPSTQPPEEPTALAAPTTDEPQAPPPEPDSGVSALPVLLAIIAAAIVAALVVASGRRNRD